MWPVSSLKFGGTQMWDDLYADVRRFRDALPDDCAAKDRGFSIFYAPPNVGGVLLLGLNPSRKDGSYVAKEAGMAGPPAAHLYRDAVRGGTLGRRVHGLIACSKERYSEGDRQSAWARVVAGNKLNQIFFGSKDWAEWKQPAFWGTGGRVLRQRTEDFCSAAVDLVVEQLRPPAIVCEGVSTFDWLVARLSASAPERVLRASRVRQGDFTGVRWAEIAISTGAIPVLGIPHPSSARLKTAERVAVGEILTATLLGKSPLTVGATFDSA